MASNKNYGKRVKRVYRIDQHVKIPNPFFNPFRNSPKPNRSPFFQTPYFIIPNCAFFSFINSTCKILVNKWKTRGRALFVIGWLRKSANKTPRQICDVLVSDWLEFPIHIHNKFYSVLQTKQVVDVWRRVVRWGPVFTLEGRRLLTLWRIGELKTYLHPSLTEGEYCFRKFAPKN